MLVFAEMRNGVHNESWTMMRHNKKNEIKKERSVENCRVSRIITFILWPVACQSKSSTSLMVFMKLISMLSHTLRNS